MPTWTSLPQAFKNAGWLVLGAGKYFHDGDGGLGYFEGGKEIFPGGTGAPPQQDPVSWMAENAIAQAIRRGALDDLPNKGKPLQVRPEESVPWAFDPTEAALMRTIKSQGFTLESIACRDELDRLRSEVVGASRSALRGGGGAAAARAAASARLDELIAATRALNAAVAREQLASRALHYPVAQRPLPTLEELLAKAGVAKGGR